MLSATQELLKPLDQCFLRGGAISLILHCTYLGAHLGVSKTDTMLCIVHIHMHLYIISHIKCVITYALIICDECIVVNGLLLICRDPTVKPHAFRGMLPKLLVSSLGQSVPDLSTPSQISESSWILAADGSSIVAVFLSVLLTPCLGLLVSLLNVRVQERAVTVVICGHLWSVPSSLCTHPGNQVQLCIGM